MSRTAVVIGAGFGGLSVAPLLAKNGWEVTVLEKNHMAGGRAITWENKGFTFDMGPSWYMMPDVFEKYFQIFGKQVSDFYQLQRLDPAYRIYFGPKDYVDMSPDYQQVRKLFDRLEPDGASKLDRYLEQAGYQYQIAMDKFIYKSYSSWADLIDKDLMLNGMKLQVFGSIGDLAAKFFTNPQARKILLYTIVFLGGSPKVTPALYSIMSHIDFKLGVWYPKGGLTQVALSLQKLAESFNVKFNFNTEVSEIKVVDNQVSKIMTNNGEIKADIVIANADYHHVESKLLQSNYRNYTDKYWQSRVMAPSAVMMYLGLNRKIKTLAHHTLFFDSDWTKDFDSIFSKPQWPDKPSFYLCAPSITDSTIAPKGKDSLFVLIPVAVGLQDTEEIKQMYYEQILDRLSNLTGEDFASAVEFKKIIAQSDFTDLFNAYKGTALGLAHTLWQTAIFRPSHRNKKVRGLYYTGQYTHPGIGVPITLISSQIVSQLISHDIPNP